VSRGDVQEVTPGGDPADVTPDGSPVAVYRALPAEPGFTPLLAVLRPPARVLDLGCGAGRLANLLAARGFAVTGVDASSAMLAGLTSRVRAVRSRIEELRLGERYDVVVLASQLVNEPDAGRRRALLLTARVHLVDDGAVFLEHLDPALPTGPPERTAMVGSVEVRFRVLAVRGQEIVGEVRYTLDAQTWTQRFTSLLLDDDVLEHDLAAVGLAGRRRLSPTWLQAEPTASGPPVASAPNAGTEPRSERPWPPW
jgi:SAM-dependent methyltransferase